MDIVTIIILGVAVLVLVLIYNSLVNKKNQVENAFGGMDAQLKKRYDLIPNLVSTVKEYKDFEQKTLTKVTELRAKAMSGKLSNDERIAVDNQISKALGGIMVAVEDYPDLKANENFMHLQRSLNEVEEQISASRRAYNAIVTEYNNAVEMFPSNIMAGFMGYSRKPVFEIAEVERQNINVKKLFNE